MACANANVEHSNGSQFFITLGPTESLQKKNTIFGKVSGETIYNAMEINNLEVGEDDRCVPSPPHHACPRPSARPHLRQQSRAHLLMAKMSFSTRTLFYAGRCTCQLYWEQRCCGTPSRILCPAPHAQSARLSLLGVPVVLACWALRERDLFVRLSALD